MRVFRAVGSSRFDFHDQQLPLLRIQKLKTEGGYLILRRSHVGWWWPHFLWSKDVKPGERIFVASKRHGGKLILYHPRFPLAVEL